MVSFENYDAKNFTIDSFVHPTLNSVRDHTAWFDYIYIICMNKTNRQSHFDGSLEVRFKSALIRAQPNCSTQMYNSASIIHEEQGLSQGLETN